MIQTTSHRAAPSVAPILGSTLLTHGTAVHTVADLPELRSALAAAWSRTLPAPVFRQADDQTILGLAALRQALDRLDNRDDDFADWGVLAAPRYFGRAAHAGILERTKIDGPWGVSPHYVPHRSLHSLPGMISLALRAHGPNLGVGGGPGAESEVMLAAAAWLHGDRLPGVWIVCTGYSPEPVPDPQGQLPPDSVCRAVVLALTTAETETEGRCLRFRMVCRRTERRGASSGQHEGEGFTLESLLTALTRKVDYPTTWIWNIKHGVVELDRPGVRGEMRR